LLRFLGTFKNKRDMRYMRDICDMSYGGTYHIYLLYISYLLYYQKS